ncbi:MAG: hypothetical protein JEZ05_00525 [Tenericutes bacterium]|nr:hypothetical protein [Mycoplasmatota bacterium]
MKKIAFIGLLITISFCIGCDNNNSSATSSTTYTTTVEEVTTTEAEPPVEFFYAEGLYNFKFANDTIRETFLAAAEDYLLDTMYSGIPLYAGADYYIYNHRVDLPTDKYISVLAYGDEFGSMTIDDSSVLMGDGHLGNTREYTFRSTVSAFGQTYNQWIADTSSDSIIMELYLDSLYDFVINDSENGFNLVPSMASNEPIPIESSQSEFDITVSYKWQIPIKDNLEWYFSPETNSIFLNNIDSYDTTISATDFVDTYKLAIDGSWFRAVSGGNDFLSSAHIIEGLEDYMDGSGSWEDVGLKVVDNNIEFTFITELDSWDVMYLLSSIHLTPINTDLYNFLKNDGDSETNYGDSFTNIAYSGPYYITSINEDILNLEENPMYYDKDKYSYTGFEFHLTGDYSTIKDLFDNGYLDYFKVSINDVSEYRDNYHVVEVPNGIINRLNLNATGSVAEFNKLFPDTNYTPEPILADQNFRLAMFYAIDRLALTEALGNGVPIDRLFTDTALLSIEKGINYRYTDIGMSVGSDMSPETYGYNLEKAVEYFNLALDTAMALGLYERGTVDNYTIINLDLDFVLSDGHTILANFIKDAFEDNFISNEYYIKVIVTINEMDYPNIYWDNMKIGDFDMFVGGVANSNFSITNSLNLFCSDNRSAFLMNFGYDTSIAEIEVEYIDMSGDSKAEIWSFDAIISALAGEVILENGEEIS